MGENLENSHVPQQRRRNKLRVMVQTHQPQTLFSQISSPFNNTIINNNNNHPLFNNTKPPPPPNSFLFLTESASYCSASSSSSSQLEYPETLHNNLSHHFVVHDGGSQDHSCSDLMIGNLGPVVPFTGYASILKRSRFLKPAQQLLEELCGSVLDHPMFDGLCENVDHEDPISGTGGNAVQHQWKDSILGCMLEEVYKKYILYCQQMQSVVASFQKVAGLGNATPYISFGIKTISKHFGCLKHAINDKLQFISMNNNPSANNNSNQKENLKYLSFEKGLNPSSMQRLQSVQPILRSQRGLPEHAVALLRKWLFEHFLHPYPSDSEKDALAQQTGLSRCQVSNWFINARVRIWKPMVEEMHMHGEQLAQPSQVNHSATMSSKGQFTAFLKPM